MRVSEAFPSNYLKASDLQGKNVVVTINHIVMEDVGDDHKPIVYFQGKAKGLVLNKTNANNIVVLYGDDMDAWIGKPITLFPAMVDFQGRTVEAIRVKAASGQMPARAPVAPPVAPTTQPPQAAYFDGDPGSDVPF